MTAPQQTRAARIVSLDLIRGAVMVLMAVDHVRVYSGLPPGGPTPGIFFTRWITHFCAPAFVFLAGTGAFLHGQRLDNRAELSRYLVTRGLWVVLLELTVVRLSWTFNLAFGEYLLAGVLWGIGWSMIVLALLVHLPLRWIAVVGGVIVAGHNLLNPIVPRLAQAAEDSSFGWLWQILYLGGGIRLGSHGPVLAVLYVLVPWVGVMALGYAFGAIVRLDPEERRRLCLRIGLGATALFLLLRATNLYGDPRPWGTGTMPAILAFLNTTKYPASLLFLLMTLGPTIALIPLLEHARGKAAEVLAVFGRVPLYYYLLHIPLIHALALLVSRIREGQVNPWLFANHPVMVPPPPEGYPWRLGLLYLVTGIAVTLLYFPCRWFAGLKARPRAGWLSYL
jgi:uncharacterized membrane protein